MQDADAKQPILQGDCFYAVVSCIQNILVKLEDSGVMSSLEPTRVGAVRRTVLTP